MTTRILPDLRRYLLALMVILIVLSLAVYDDGDDANDDDTPAVAVSLVIKRPV